MNRKLLLGGLLVAAVAIPLRSSAFKISEVTAGSGITLGWGKRNINWTLHKKQDGNLAATGTDFDAALAAIQTSFDSWDKVPCADIAFTYDGPTSRVDLGFDKDNQAGNINLLVFRDSGLCNDTRIVPANDPCHATDSCANEFNCWEHDSATYALTTTNYNISTGELADVDIEFNATPGVHRFTTASESAPRCPDLVDPLAVNCTATDVQNTATHEIGHFIGIDHSALKTSSMYFSAEDAETSKRHLTEDDEDAVCSLYPTWSAASTESGCASAGPSMLGALLLVMLVSLRKKANLRKF